MMSSSRALAKGVGLAAGTALAAAGGWVLYSRLFINHHEPLPEAILAERSTFSTVAGRLSYYHDKRTSGRPLVLIHSVNAAASAYEMRPLFEKFREVRPVFALELPGYGFSSRPDIPYTPQLFADAIGEFLTTQVQEPADVVALSLSCEFAARASLAHPQRFHSLGFISPTGLSGKAKGQADQRKGDTFYAIASQPLWRQAFFDLIASPASIRFFLNQSFVGRPPQALVSYSYLTSHRPGAENVPLYFLSGKLFTPQIRQLYETMTTPTLVLYDQDAFVNFARLPALLAEGSHWRARRLSPSRGLPQFEMLGKTTDALETFWQDIG